MRERKPKKLIIRSLKSKKECKPSLPLSNTDSMNLFFDNAFDVDSIYVFDGPILRIVFGDNVETARMSCLQTPPSSIIILERIHWKRWQAK